MPGAGEYPTRWAWAARSYAGRGAAGDRGDSYAAAVPLWGTRVDESSGVAEQLGAKPNERRGQVRFRQRVGVKRLDRLTDPGTAEAWEVESVSYDHVANETLAQVSRTEP